MRHAVGVTQKLWKPVSEEDRVGFRKMAEAGFSFRDIGKRFGRDHHVVSYNLKEDKDRLLALETARERRRAKITKPEGHRRLMQKLSCCLQQARRTAEKKGLPIDIDMAYLLDLHHSQNGLCKLSGIVLETTRFEGHRTNPRVISVDRIYPSLGYVRGNVRLIIWGLNCALGEWGEEYFAELARVYLLHRERQSLATPCAS